MTEDYCKICRRTTFEQYLIKLFSFKTNKQKTLPKKTPYCEPIVSKAIDLWAFFK